MLNIPGTGTVGPRTVRFLLFAGIFAGAAAAQTPVVSDDGVVNGASFAAGQGVAAGSIVSIFGVNLAPSTALASMIPLPTVLNGVSVSFNGTPAPLFFVSASQINAQLPWEVASGTATVIVSVNGANSPPKTFNVTGFGPGIFSAAGKGIVINSDGSLAQPVGSLAGFKTTPASAGSTVVILTTGLGAVNSPIMDGANSLDMLRNTVTTPTVLIGGYQAHVAFSGMSPQFVGVNQLNVVIPETVTTGDAVPVQIAVGGVSSASVSMAVNGASSQIPVEYSDLYPQLKTNLDAFGKTVTSGWNGTKTPVNFAADLYPADNAAGGKAGDPTYYAQSVTPFLNAVQELGIKAAKVTVSFPVLYQPYYNSSQGANNPTEYSPTLTFYSQLAQDVHSRGLKLIVVSQLVHADQQNVAPYLKTLDANSYAAGRSAVVNLLIQTMKPDWMIVQAEPQTEENDLAANPTLAKMIADPSSDAAFVMGMLDSVNTLGLHSPSMLIGAGMGTWQHTFPDFLSSLTQIPSLQVLDIHLYPINNVNGTDYFGRVLTMADAGKAAGKHVGMSEAWLYKIRDSELGQSGETSTAIYSRDVFSLWAPLDQEFLQDNVNAAYWKGFDYMSPFFDKYFYGYLDYNNTPGCPVPADMTCSSQVVDSLANAALSMGLAQQTVTSTGVAYSNMIK